MNYCHRASPLLRKSQIKSPPNRVSDRVETLLGRSDSCGITLGLSSRKGLFQITASRIPYSFIKEVLIKVLVDRI